MPSFLALREDPKWAEVSPETMKPSIQSSGDSRSEVKLLSRVSGAASNSLDPGWWAHPSVPWRTGLLRKAVSIFPESREPETRARWVRKMLRQADEPSQGAKLSHQQVRGPIATEHIWKPMIRDFQSLPREKSLLFPQFVFFFPGGLVSGTGRSVYSCVTLGESRNLSELLLVHRQNGNCNCHSL